MIAILLTFTSLSISAQDFVSPEKEIYQLSLVKALYAACASNLSPENESMYHALEHSYTQLADHIFSSEGGKEAFDVFYQVQFNALREAYLQGFYSVNLDQCNDELDRAINKARVNLAKHLQIAIPK